MSAAGAYYEAWAATGGAPIPGDRILLSGLRVRGHHEVLHEAQLGQVFVVDLGLTSTWPRPGGPRRPRPDGGLR